MSSPIFLSVKEKKIFPSNVKNISATDVNRAFHRQCRTEQVMTGVGSDSPLLKKCRKTRAMPLVAPLGLLISKCGIRRRGIRDTAGDNRIRYTVCAIMVKVYTRRANKETNAIKR